MMMVVVMQVTMVMRRGLTIDRRRRWRRRRQRMIAPVGDRPALISSRRQRRRGLGGASDGEVGRRGLVGRGQRDVGVVRVWVVRGEVMVG